MRRPSRRTAGTVAAMLATLVVAFSLGWWIGPGSNVDAQLIDRASDPDLLTATPSAGQQPDFTQEFWYQEWLNEWSMAPVYDQVINGIAVGPDVLRLTDKCDAVGTAVDISDAPPGRVAIDLPYLPEGASTSLGDVALCGDDPVSFSVDIEIDGLSDRNLRERMNRGEAFFDLPHGGWISVHRFVGGPAMESSLPARQWESGMIAGIPAAIGHPLFDDGFGIAHLIVHSEGVVTSIQATNVSLSELIRVAEGVLK